MTQKIPRWEIEELILEYIVTKKTKILVVEGNHDRDFFERWALLSKVDEKKFRIETIDNVNVPDDLLIQYQLCSGARSRVLMGAIVADKIQDGRQGIRFIADRDMGQDLEKFVSSPCLLVTDYPAIESYGLSLDVLNWFNRHQCGNKLPINSQIYDDLCGVLCQLYELRKDDPHREGPKYEKGVPRKKQQRKSQRRSLIKDFNSAKAFGYLSSADTTIDHSISGDPREFAYGHDIIGVLYSVYNEEFKKLHYVKKEKAEKDFRDAILDVGVHKNEKLFHALCCFLNVVIG